MPQARRHVEDAKRFFQTEYNVRDKDITLLNNASFKACRDEYLVGIPKQLKSGKKTLIIHVLAGHGVQFKG